MRTLRVRHGSADEGDREQCDLGDLLRPEHGVAGEEAHHDVEQDDDELSDDRAADQPLEGLVRPDSPAPARGNVTCMENFLGLLGESLLDA